VRKEGGLGIQYGLVGVLKYRQGSCCQPTWQSKDRLANRNPSACTVQSGPRYGDFRTLTCCNPSCSDFRYSESNKPGHVLICIVSCIPRGCNLVNMVRSVESLQTKRLSRKARGSGWVGGCRT
jgi:hypothetical protein